MVSVLHSLMKSYLPGLNPTLLALGLRLEIGAITCARTLQVTTTHQVPRKGVGPLADHPSQS